MNKYKKIAAIAVTAVMAGSMVGMMAACAPTGDTDTRVQLRMNVGNRNTNNQMAIAYRTTDISGTVTMPDGVTYSANDLKPAWAEASEKLNINFIDAFVGEESNNQISLPCDNNQLGNYDVITGSLQTIVEYSDNFLNLTPYLDSMPNYKAFLDANPVVRYSLTADATGAMYAAPYFDGLNDIEKYELFNKIWVANILDGDITGKGAGTFLAQAKAKGVVTGDSMTASVQSFMGKANSWSVDTTKRDDTTSTVKVYVNYDKAKEAAMTPSKALYQALDVVTGVDSTQIGELDSGNIVDIMNLAINKSGGAVTGAQLINILREYIRVAYYADETFATPFYTRAGYKLSDVFCAVDAAWDVDLLAALSRCVCTATDVLGSTAKTTPALVYGIAARAATTQRRVDLITLAGTLYGFRGADNSRYEYAYINSKGELKDSRMDPETYEYLNKFNAFTKEGLLSKADMANTVVKDTKEDTVQAMMIHDYAQTQTTGGLETVSIDAETGAEKTNGTTNLAEYNFAPVVTPVSKWDTNDDTVKDTTMRFTESWRSVKNTGFCVPAIVKNDARKLDAVINFIDYLFSSDGQILMTYGYEATNSDFSNGWWKGALSDLPLDTVIDKDKTIEAQTIYEKNADGTEVLDENGEKVVARVIPAQYTLKDEYKSKVFVYDGKVYTGVAYNGRVVPEITTKNMNLYLGKEVDGTRQNAGNLAVSAIGNYTNYARRILGTTLPIGNKDQGFEYQCTAACGLDGAANVSAGLVNGTIKHIKLSVTADEGSWYLTCPTSLPLDAAARTAFKNEVQTLLSGKIFVNSSSTKNTPTTNMFIDYIFFGYNGGVKVAGTANLGDLPTTKDLAITYVTNRGMESRLKMMQAGWDTIKTMFSL